MKKTLCTLLTHAVCLQSASAASLPHPETCWAWRTDLPTCTQAFSRFDFNTQLAMPDIWQHDRPKPWQYETEHPWQWTQSQATNNGLLRSPKILAGQTATLKTSFVSTGGQVAFDLSITGATGNLVAFPRFS